MIKLIIHTLSIVIILLWANQQLFSQTFYNTELHGIIKSVNGESITRAHIVNLFNQTGTISNNNGEFQILVNKTDIIQISSVGYKSFVYVIPNTDQVKLVKYFTLSVDTVSLDETTIYPFPESLAELKREFLELPIEEEAPLYDLHLEDAGILGRPQTGAIIHGPFSALYEKFSRSAKMRRKYLALLEYDHKKQEASKIYNAELVTKLTGLSSKKEIAEFMEYCEFEPDFVLHAKSYDLYLAIENCFAEFSIVNQ